MALICLVIAAFIGLADARLIWRCTYKNGPTVVKILTCYDNCCETGCCTTNETYHRSTSTSKSTSYAYYAYVVAGVMFLVSVLSILRCLCKKTQPRTSVVDTTQRAAVLATVDATPWINGIGTSTGRRSETQRTGQIYSTCPDRHRQQNDLTDSDQQTNGNIVLVNYCPYDTFPACTNVAMVNESQTVQEENGPRDHSPEEGLGNGKQNTMPPPSYDELF